MNNTNKLFLGRLLALSAAPALSIGGLAASPQADSAQNDKESAPHIIFIMTDQHRWDALGCVSDGMVKTPHIDKLASDGHLFNNAYTAAPSSTPARAGLLTGMTPWHHGLLGYGKVAEHYKYEMPQMLSDLGYKTMGIGKMHWNPQNALHGFDLTLLDESGRVESPYFMSDYRKWFNTQASGLNPDSTHLGWNAHGAKKYALDEKLHPTTWTGDRAVEVIKGYESDQPLFLKISFARPHSPYDPPQRVLDLYNNADIATPVIGDWVKERHLNSDPNKNPDAAIGNFGVEYAQNSRKHYYASITFIDEQVGRIINELKEKGMYDNALICFTSDHGDMLGDHHLWRKTYAYEGSAAIPLIVKLPSTMLSELSKGETVDAPVELRDFLPTFLAINGQAVPEDMDGLSLLDPLQKKKYEWREYIDMEHATAYWDDNYWCALTDGNIKYVWYFRNGNEELFDLRKDPYEIKNVATHSAYKKELKKLRLAMVKHLSERGEEWVKDDKLVVKKKSLLYSPNYPKK